MAQAPAPTARAQYEQRLAACAVASKRAQRIHDWLAWGRVAALVAIIATGYERCGGRGGSTYAVLGAIAVFVALMVAVARAAANLGRVGEAERYYQRGLQRLAGDPQAAVSDGKAFEPAEHLYAADLDLFGPGSLFARLCTARTSNGQATLARWLLAPAGREVVQRRQQGVAELAGRLELREELWRAAGPVSQEVRADSLASWLRSPPRPVKGITRIAALSLSLAAVPVVYWLSEGRVLPAAVLLVVELLFVRPHRQLVQDIGAQAQSRVDELKAVAVLAEIVERERFESPALQAVQAALRSEGAPARKRIAALVRRVEWFESRRNPFFALVSAPFLVVTQLAFAIERWRAHHGAAAAGWLEALGELETLASLATYAFEHPDQPFPEIVPDEQGPLYDGVNVSHPLLPADTRVGNDVRLDSQARLWLVTGSNMSGKSTLLRTVGTSTVLALAGAPVPATRLRLSHLRVGASLRTVDSLQAGVSRFFAEIKRLREVVALAESSPLTLFLLDEILHGTNSQDRFAGAAAITRTLVARQAIGLVTTHDLTLAKIVDELAPAAINVHFEDVITHDELHFDYRLRPGVVSRGNALALMKLVGLPVP
jgi:MutS domain V